MHDSEDTIAAIASPLGPGVRGILRLSGEQTIHILKKILVGALPEFHERQARRYTGQVGIDEGKLQLDVSILMWPTGRSFTGEPMAEIHCVGSPPLLNEILEGLYMNGARPAERGEFTLRAFLAGRIDLVQAEAVLGVIDAGSERQLEQALDQLAGGISAKFRTIREELLIHLADLEAGLDFVEEDIDFVQRPAFLEKLETSQRFLESMLQQAEGRMQSTGRRRVVLAGLPNAGKSTLFNALAGSESAIVSPQAGTTRDYLIAEVEDEKGATFELIDTAGWETARDDIEALAGGLREEQFQRADLIVWCRAAHENDEMIEEDQQLFSQAEQIGGPILKVSTKADLGAKGLPDFDCNVSVVESNGIKELKIAIADKLDQLQTDAELIGATASRCKESLRHALDAVLRAQSLVNSAAGDELVAMELREVLEHLGRIVGDVYTDDILDRIFSRFCIGK